VELRINLAGRERHGPVQPGQPAWALLERVAGQLAELRTPSGEALLQDIAILPKRPEDLPGNHGPDLVAIANEARHYSILHPLTPDGQIFAGPPPRSVGQHRLHGIFIAYGPAITPGAALAAASLVDIAPTALHLLGLPVPEAMDGRVLTETLDPAWRAAPEETTFMPLSAWEAGGPSALTPEEASKVEETLRALGYLD
jgi:predicted AlkP superfamily phosphohydrolase/phosphomutase